MNCQDCRGIVSAYIDGELDSPEKGEVDAHVKECSSCRKELEAFQDLQGRLEGLNGVEAPPGSFSGIMRAVRLQDEATSHEKGAGIMAELLRSMFGRPAMGFASLLLVAGLAFFAGRGFQGDAVEPQNTAPVIVTSVVPDSVVMGQQLASELISAMFLRVEESAADDSRGNGHVDDRGKDARAI